MQSVCYRVKRSTMRNLSHKQNISLNMQRLLLGLPVVVVAGAALLFAQRSSAQQPAIAQAPAADNDGQVPFKQNVQVVQAPVTVLDRDGRVVTGLNALDFTLLDNGKPQPIVEDVSEHPISLVVVIQANTSMEKVLPDIRKVGGLFDNLIAGDAGEMAVIQFDHRVQTLLNFTSDPDQIHAVFKDKLKTGSTTSALNDAMMGGINLLKNRDKQRKRILIMISENRDGGSGLPVRQVLEEGEFANIIIYSLNVSQLLTSLTATPQPTRPDPIPPGGRYLPNGQVMTPTLDQQLNNNGDWSPIFVDIFRAVKGIFVPNPLDVYSRFTGAREFPFFTQKGLEQAIADIGQELHNQYILTFSVSDVRAAGYHSIKVLVDKPDLRVLTREGYWNTAKQ
jgi:VWFA-related protein